MVWLTRKQKRALLEALDKVKEELMVMGFISLLLTFSQGYIAKICIPSKVADHMLPCALDKPTPKKEEANQESPHLNKHRLLMIGDSDGSCHKGKTRKELRFIRAIVKLFHPSAISVVGEIPQGLSEFAVPKAFAYVKSLIPIAFLITGVAILESVGIAKALAAKNGYDLDSNQERFKERILIIRFGGLALAKRIEKLEGAFNIPKVDEEEKSVMTMLMKMEPW